MITEEMRQVWYGSDLSFDVDEADKKIQRIIELHEANKPKPEPVAYAYPSQYAEALENEGCFLVFAVPVTNLDTGEESSLPLYTTPPTREPLKYDERVSLVMEYMRNELIGSTMNVLKAFELGLIASEKAHGIGVK